jgi:hypothetical protein
MNNQSTSTPDAELKRRLRRASTKARFGGFGFILIGAMFLALGYFSNTPSQRQFNQTMSSGSNLGPTANKVIDNVAPLAAGRALSSPLMMLMPFVFMGLGLLSVGMGIKTIAQGASPVERQDIGEEFRIEQLIHARQNDKQTSPYSSVDSSLRFDGVYVLAKEADCEWKYLLFFKSGRVRIPSTSLTPIRAFVEESRKDSSDSSVGGWSAANYKLSGSTVTFSVPPLPKVCGRELTGAIEQNRLRLKIEYFSESSRNLYTPKTVEYSFFPIPID